MNGHLRRQRGSEGLSRVGEAGGEARHPARGGVRAPRKREKSGLAPQAQRYTQGQWPGGTGPDCTGIPPRRQEMSGLMSREGPAIRIFWSG